MIARNDIQSLIARKEEDFSHVIANPEGAKQSHKIN